MLKIKHSTITKCILATVAFAGIMTIVAIAPNSMQMLELFGIGKKKYKSSSVYSTFKRIQKQRLVDVKEKGNKTIITITEEGKKKFLSYNFDDMQITKPQKWDKKWRIVGFDIPEKRKQAREALRSKLEELGFLRMQKSFFIHPYDCKKEIEFIGEFFQIHRHITFIEATSISNENYFKYKFKLL